LRSQLNPNVCLSTSAFSFADNNITLNTTTAASATTNIDREIFSSNQKDGLSELNLCEENSNLLLNNNNNNHSLASSINNENKCDKLLITSNKEDSDLKKNENDLNTVSDMYNKLLIDNLNSSSPSTALLEANSNGYDSILSNEQLPNATLNGHHVNCVNSYEKIQLTSPALSTTSSLSSVLSSSSPCSSSNSLSFNNLTSSTSQLNQHQSQVNAHDHLLQHHSISNLRWV
jgi:hypothetical protein